MHVKTAYLFASRKFQVRHFLVSLGILMQNSEDIARKYYSTGERVRDAKL